MIVIEDPAAAPRIERGAVAEEPRVDAVAKVTGQAVYAEDLPNLPGTVYGVMVRSPYTHARVRSVASAAVEAMPGVLGTLHSRNMSEIDINLDYQSTDQQFIALNGKARYDGDIMGMVAAVDRRTALLAAEALDIDYEPLQPVLSFEEAMADGAPRIHEQLPSNLAIDDWLEWGNLEEGFREADRVFEEEYVSQNVNHHPMEPSTSFVVNFGPDVLEFWVPSNNAFLLVDQAAKLFGLPPERIRTRIPYVGGNFGGKDTCAEAIVAAALSRKIKRPIKVVASAQDSFRVSARHAMTWRAKIGVKANGTLSAMDIALDIDTGAYYTGGGIATRNALTAAFGAYRVPHLRVHVLTCYTNKTPAGTFRNTGKSQTTFGSDCAIDNIARHLCLDPIEFRLKNVYQLGESVGPPTWRLSSSEMAAPKALDSDLPEMIRKAVRAMGWDRGGRTSGSGRFAFGRGLALSLRRGSDSSYAEALASADETGRVLISHNAPEVGGGAYTMISVVAAETLGLPRGQIRVGEPDSSTNLRFRGVSSQRTTVQMGTAVQAACEDLLEKLAAAAAEARGGQPHGWRLHEGRLERDGQSLSFGDIVRTVGQPITGKGTYPRNPQDEREHVSRNWRQPGAEVETDVDQTTGATRIIPHDHWAPGVGAVDVEVDRATGDVRLLRALCVADAGKVLHYHSARGQILGGAVMGMSIAISEEMVYDEGQLTNGDPFQYRLAAHRDIPHDFEVIFEEKGDGPGPFGAKAVAQVSISTMSPAICNAIYDAIGVRLRSTPFTPEKVLRALGILKAVA